jgi:hypothetical protein
MPVYTNLTDPAARAEEIANRVHELIHLNRLTVLTRSKIRDIMNGGPEGIKALVGKEVSDQTAYLVPAANMLLKAADRTAQKIGKLPDTKVDPPNASDSDRARDAADRRARIISSYDRAVNLKLQLPQVGRWLPGYGFVPWVVRQRMDVNRDPYPALELRDPFNAYPGVWTINQQPPDLAFRHVLPLRTLERMFPEVAAGIKGLKVGAADATSYLPRERGGVILGSGRASGGATGGIGSPSWSNQANEGIEVFEYHDHYGEWWVLGDGSAILHYVPNLLDRPAFVVAKRFSFDRLAGQYDQLIGLIAAQARLNVLAITAAEDTVNTETNVIGDMVAGRYQRGRRAVNYLTPGSRVEKSNDRVPFEAFTQIDRLERQIRNMATYPVTDDAISPNSFVTEVGLTELKGSVEDEYTEHRLVIGSALETADSLRLEWIETYYPDATLNMEGYRAGGSFADTYRPSTHIKGNYRTRRVYGAMAGFDDANKIVVGSVLQDKGVIDTETFRENVDGLEDHAKIRARIHSERMEQILYQMMAAGAEQLDPRVIDLIIEELPDGKRKDLFREIFQQEEEEPSPEEMMAAAAGDVPDVTTVLNRLTTNSAPTAGVQTVGRSG